MALVSDGGGATVYIHKLLQDSDLSFRDFVEIALYHPDFGYYTRERHPAGKEADYVTSPLLSPLFSYSLGKLVREFLDRHTDVVCSIVDIGSGDGSLIRELAKIGGARYFGVDRAGGGAGAPPRLRTIDEIPRGGAHLIMSNELFDAFPFARLVQRDEHLHELWVTERDGALDWSEHEAPFAYEDYFAARNIQLQDGQFADVSLEWEATYGEICDVVERGLIVTFDYGYPSAQLFHPRARRFGTAAAYAKHQATRDLLANPGQQDLTAHINFDDLMRAGEARGFHTRFFDRQAKFLLALGAAEHEIFSREAESVEEALALREAKEDARRLILPDDIGHDLRVLVQAKNIAGGAWSFERPLF